MEERLRAGEVADMEVHVSHDRAVRHAGPGLPAAGGHEIADRERLGRHPQLTVGVFPSRAGTVGVYLDSEAVRIVQFNRLAHQVIRHPRRHPDRRQMGDEAAEGRPVRQQDREVEQPQRAAAADTAQPGRGLQPDEDRRAVVRRQRCRGGGTLDRAQAEHAFVERHRAVEIADQEPHRAHGGRRGEAVAGRNNSLGLPRVRLATHRHVQSSDVLTTGVITLICAKKFRSALDAAPHAGQQIDELFQVFAVHMPELTTVNPQDLLIETFQQGQPLRRDPGGDIAAIVAIAHARQQARLFHAIEQPRHIRDPAHQPLSDLVAAQPIGTGAAKNPQHVVLRRRDVERLQRLHQRMLQDRCRARDVEGRLFLEAAPRLVLLEVVL